MNRRSFLQTMLAACAAPAIVRAESIMRIKPVLLPGEDFEFTTGMAGGGNCKISYSLSPLSEKLPEGVTLDPKTGVLSVTGNAQIGSQPIQILRHEVRPTSYFAFIEDRHEH